MISRQRQLMTFQIIPYQTPSLKMAPVSFSKAIRGRAKSCKGRAVKTQKRASKFRVISKILQRMRESAHRLGGKLPAFSTQEPLKLGHRAVLRTRGAPASTRTFIDLSNLYKRLQKEINLTLATSEGDDNDEFAIWIRCIMRAHYQE